MCLNDNAQSLTGYVTVTATVVATVDVGETGVKAILRDESSAIDFVTWEEDPASRLTALKDECVAVQNAEVREFEGKRQLGFVAGPTQIQTVQPGVGYTDAPIPESGQEFVSDAAADGDEIDGEGVSANVRNLRRALLQVDNEGKTLVSKPALFERVRELYDVPPSKLEDALEDATKEGAFLEPTEGEYEAR